MARLLMARFLMGGLLVGVLLMGGTSCSWKSAIQPSILVIMVENLGFGAFSCGDDSTATEESGFRAFCDESVRFTHAYTPSTQGQAAVASILTGRYPHEHGVRHNGALALSAQTPTVGKAAVKAGYRTSFFSGGPPIWRRSGFHQGMEIFDDNVQLSLNHLYRSAVDIVSLFLNWQEAEAPRGKFLSVLFLADLQFIDAPTTNAIGELRESSYAGQVDEVGEALGKLVREMKARKIWDSTSVFLLGLNGNGQTAEPRYGEVRPLNLYSEVSHVTLMIKPSRKTRDGPFNWKIDSNVGLADIGATLFELIGGRPDQRKASVPPVVSLVGALKGPEPDWPDERMILSESAWTRWRGLGPIRYAVRKGPYLYLHDDPVLLFNTLTDSMESAPLPLSDARDADLRGEFARFIGSINGNNDNHGNDGGEPWVAPGRSWIEKMDLARELWRDRAPTGETLARLRALAKRDPQDAQLQGWRAIWALRLNDWSELKLLSTKTVPRPVWAFVAARNLGEKKSPLPGDDPCFDFLKAGGDRRVPKSCSAEGLTDLLQWMNEGAETSVRNRAMENFLRGYVSRALATRIAEQNYLTGLAWDTNLARLQGPEVVDLVLALPEMRKYRSAVGRRIIDPH